MNKARWLKIVNVLLLIFAANQALTGMGNELIGEKVFEALHPLGGVLFTICAIIHVIMNRAWIKANFFKK